MNLKDVASVSGKGGLFRVIKPTRTGVILENLDGTNKRWIASATSRVSILREISIYTTGEESSVLLEEVYNTIHEKYNSDLPVSTKSTPDQLASFLVEILPDYDTERVYKSDIKKLISWYNLLLEFMPEVFVEKSQPKTVETSEEVSDEKA